MGSVLSKKQVELCDRLGKKGALRLADATAFVAGLTDFEFGLVVKDLEEGAYFMNRLDKHRAEELARKKAASAVEVAFVDGHDNLSATVQAIVEVDRRESI